MAMEEAVIVRPNKEKKFAFIEREGKPDLHCGTRCIPDVEEGDRVSFEEATSDRGPTARKVKILQRADGSPYVPGNRKTEEPQGIGVGIEIGTPQVIEEEEKVGDTDEVIKVLRLMLPVLVSLTRGNQKVRDMEVIFEPNGVHRIDRKSTRLNSSHQIISYAVFCLKKKKSSHSVRRHID